NKMKIFLSILLAIVLIVGGFFAWFFLFFLNVPELSIPEGATEQEKIEALDSWLSELEQAHKFNGAVLIARDSKPLLMKGYGYADHQRQDRLTENSSFRLASVSKQFTATGILLLAEKDSLTIDDPVARHIDGFPYPEVTIRHLLNQTSGVPDVYMQLADQHQDEFEILSNEKAVALVVAANKPAVASPGAKFQYSNTNYILLARIIEVVSGKSFEAFMQEALFDPLEMTHTRVWNLFSADKHFPGQVEDVKNFKGKMKRLEPTPIDGVAGDGAVFCSVSDFLKWDAFWYGNQLVSPELMAEARQKPVLGDGSSSDYGFGWMISDKGMWHNGSWLGAQTLIVRNTDRKTCLVVLDNSSNVFLENIIDPLRQVFGGF
ncbi:MAG: serine hydrolase domain-containing protein, partial [Bacteroidota bacterium]